MTAAGIKKPGNTAVTIKSEAKKVAIELLTCCKLLARFTSIVSMSLENLLRSRPEDSEKVQALRVMQILTSGSCIMESNGGVNNVIQKLAEESSGCS